jgi:hypothetical protein
MSVTTESQIFRLCIEQPLKIQKDLSQLNLQFIKDPKQKDDDHLESASDDSLEKK